MFKKGQKIKCLREYPGQFTVGKIYEAREDQQHYVVYVVADDTGQENGWGHGYFELVEWKLNIDSGTNIVTNTCTCIFRNLLINGCKCGAFEREQRSKYV